MATPNIVPRADSEGGLGTASKYWASAYIDFIYVGAGKIGRDADNLIDFTTDNQITFRVSTGDNVVMKASGEIEASSFDISGNIDIDANNQITLDADGGNDYMRDGGSG